MQHQHDSWWALWCVAVAQWSTHAHTRARIHALTHSSCFDNSMASSYKVLTNAKGHLRSGPDIDHAALSVLQHPEKLVGPTRRLARSLSSGPVHKSSRRLSAVALELYSKLLGNAHRASELQGCIDALHRSATDEHELPHDTRVEAVRWLSGLVKVLKEQQVSTPPSSLEHAFVDRKHLRCYPEQRSSATALELVRTLGVSVESVHRQESAAQCQNLDAPKRTWGFCSIFHRQLGNST
eukprot:m.98850 g.98850  ORF g.98850 m.98850 type:complete len:238 (+) comp12445_c0_seq5:335-1048(+)